MRVDDLLTAATDETGLDDFGDESFREGLERLVASVVEERPSTSWAPSSSPC